MSYKADKLNGGYLITASTIPPKTVPSLCIGWLAAGNFHLLAGQTGTGKTTLGLNMAGGPLATCHLGESK
jgi:RecA-family ATPase